MGTGTGIEKQVGRNITNIGLLTEIIDSNSTTQHHER
jgi:hypothetical protein